MYIRRKVFSTYVDEKSGEEKMFSTTEYVDEESYVESLYSELEEREYAEKEKSTHKKIRGGSNARIWMDKKLQTKKDREAMIEAYDQEGDRNSHKLGKQVAKKAAILGGVLGGAGTYAALKDGEMKAGRGAAEALKAAGAGKKIVKAALKNPKTATAALATAGAGLGAGIYGAHGYVGTRAARAIGKKVEDLSETAAHDSQKTADENKVAAGKMSRDEFAQKYGRNIKPSQRREFKKQ
jgi:hypothetical protein